jgi:hypothetical protein
MPGPTFDYVPIFGGATAKLGSLIVQGVSTKHGDTKTDRGRLYVKLVKVDPTYTLTLHSAASRSDGSKVASGTVAALSTFFDLAVQNSSGISGQASIASYESDDSTMVAVPTFAMDPDVFVQAAYVANMPGYDTTYGLGYFHARAMRQLLTTDLPRAVKFLYPGGVGLAAFVPTDPAVTLPDLTQLAQAQLAKAMSAEESGHMEEWATMATAARERFDEIMAALADANTKDEEAGDQDATNQSVSVGTWERT